MRRVFKVLITILLFVALSACRQYSNYNVSEIKALKKSIAADYEQIKEMKVQYSIPVLEFIYTFKEEINEKQMFDIFYKTKQVILEEGFQKEFFSTYFKRYSGAENQEKVYPEAYIMFDFNNDSRYEFQFESMYYKQPYRSDSENEIDGYNKWTYWDFKSDAKPVPEK